MGIDAGSSFRATPEEQEAIDRAEAERVATGIKEMHQLMDRPWRCCAVAEGSRVTGLCPDCTHFAVLIRSLENEVIARLEPDAKMADKINGKSRRQLCEPYIARQSWEDTWHSPIETSSTPTCAPARVVSGSAW
jgi:hypothetical protein